MLQPMLQECDSRPSSPAKVDGEACVTLVFLVQDTLDALLFQHPTNQGDVRRERHEEVCGVVTNGMGFDDNGFRGRTGEMASALATLVQ